MKLDMKVFMKLDMKVLKTSVVALALLVGLSPAGFAQQSQPNQPDHSVVAAEISPAIAWSETQTPQPMATEKATPAPDQQQQAPDSTAATPTQASGAQAQPDSATQTFTGTIVRVGDKYVLKTTDNMTYQLDDPDKAKDFEGKQVKVTGGLDTKAKLIHIQTVELVP
jgi:hypothetical protein